MGYAGLPSPGDTATSLPTSSSSERLNVRSSGDTSQLESKPEVSSQTQDTAQPHDHPLLPKQFDTPKKRCELAHILLSASLDAAKTCAENHDSAFLQIYRERHAHIAEDRGFCDVPEWDSLTRWHLDESAWAETELQRTAGHKHHAVTADSQQGVAQDVKRGVQLMFDEHEDELVQSKRGLIVYHKLMELRTQADAFLTLIGGECADLVQK
ncbi:MAG: hypothetical protein Q9159_003249 [Coniocarpon cinnabarinum]